MLDAATKARIDSARDILVGKVPDPKSQVEQITIALIYKFMDDMDRESEDLGGVASFFSGEFKKYVWSRLLDKSLGGHERLALYAEGITVMDRNPNIPQLFRDIFKGAFLPYRDPETLNLFLKEINGFTYDHSERLGDAFEYLLSVLGSQGEAGQFRTPRHIIDFIVAIVDPQKHETVLDPACGTAGFLISAYKHILARNADERPGDRLSGDKRERLMGNFCGYDISPDMVRLSRANLYLHGFANPRIHEYDTLTSEDRWDERYDVIMANPPFMSPTGGIRPHNRFSIKATRSEVLFVDYIAEHLHVGGRAGVIVPEGIIFQGQNAYKDLRRMLVKDYLWCVVSLPGGVFNPYSGVKTSILLLDKGLAKRSDAILFVKVAADGFDLGAQRRSVERNDLPEAERAIAGWKAGQQPAVGSLAHAVRRQRILESADVSLSGDRYKDNGPAADLRWPMVKIGDFVEDLQAGFAYGEAGVEVEGIPHLRPMNISSSGDLVWEGTKFIPRSEIADKQAYLLRKGDVLFNNTNSKELVGKTCYIGENVEAVFSNHMTRIRADLSKVEPVYLATLLHDLWRRGHFLTLCNKWVGQAGINVRTLATVEFPLPPLDVQRQIVAELDGYRRVIEGARQVVANYKPTIRIDPSWPMVELGDLCTMQYGHTASARETGDTRFVRITDITAEGTLSDKDSKFIEMSDDARDCLLRKGDVLVARTGATYGKVLLYRDEEQAVFASYLIRLLFDERVDTAFFWAFAQSDLYWRQARELVAGGAQPQFNANAIKSVRMPLPPLHTQRQIVAEIEAERALVESNRKLVALFEKKTRDRLAEIWSEASEAASAA
jgi:type I restriction enzyme M protein